MITGTMIPMRAMYHIFVPVRPLVGLRVCAFQNLPDRRSQESLIVLEELVIVVLVVGDSISPFCDRHGEQIDAKTAFCATDFKGASGSALPQFVHCLAV